MIKKGLYSLLPDFESGVELIHRRFQAESPFMAARFGSVEIKGMLYPKLPVPLRYAFRSRTFGTMRNNAGFFPPTEESLKRFSKLMLNDSHEVDILGSWRIEEFLIRSHLRKAVRIPLNVLEPYLSNRPWTANLAGKNVLVIHPFNKTIESQYSEHREKIFQDQTVLPKFKSLQTIRAIQTIGGERSKFQDWFEALDFMRSQIDTIDFDVAILGCGAYGFPLAAHIKRKGKTAIHLGGATQILFGIRGKRWDNHPVISGFYNDHWTRPGMEDTPSMASSVENGCYW
ncbi:MAG: hypothetical protein RL173_872 [Fibrobacterota bacterium]|jgi:hypothetical protein